MGKPPKVKAPPVPAPQAIPTVGEDTQDEAIKKARRASGYSKTIVTGSLAPQSTGKKALLGG